MDSLQATHLRLPSCQTQTGPALLQLEGEWVSAVRKNIEIESQCLRLERECVLLRQGV